MNTWKTNRLAAKSKARESGGSIVLENVAFFAAATLQLNDGDNKVPERMAVVAREPNIALYGLFVGSGRPVVLLGWESNACIGQLVNELDLSQSDVDNGGGAGFVGVKMVSALQCSYDEWMADAVKRGIDHDRFLHGDIGAVAIAYNPSFISYYEAHQPPMVGDADAPAMLRYGRGYDGGLGGKPATIDEVVHSEDEGYKSPAWLREVETPEVRAHEGCLDALYGVGKGVQIIGGKPVRRNGDKMWFGVCGGCGEDISATKGVDFEEGRRFPADTQFMNEVRRSVDRIAAREMAYAIADLKPSSKASRVQGESDLLSELLDAVGSVNDKGERVKAFEPVMVA